LCQTFQDFEIIVVDGHSIDKGPEIVKSIRDSRLYPYYTTNKGVSEARNFGVQTSRGSLIAFLDADDEWSPQHLETLMHLREKFPNAGLYATTYKIIEFGNIVKIPKFRTVPQEEGLIPNYFLAMTLGDSVFVTTCVGIPKDIFTDVGGFLPGVQWERMMISGCGFALKFPIAYSWSGEAIWHCEASNRLTDNIPISTREPVVERDLAALSHNSVSKGGCTLLTGAYCKVRNQQGFMEYQSRASEKARDILRDAKLPYFTNGKFI